MTESSEEDLEVLVAAAREVIGFAHAPYSGSSFGAAVLTDGGIFTGVNVENASFPLSVCAERNAVAAMLAGGARRIDAVAVVADAREPVTPCGGCRQVLAEFSADDVPVISELLDGRRGRWTTGELLPHPFRLDR